MRYLGLSVKSEQIGARLVLSEGNVHLIGHLLGDRSWTRVTNKLSPWAFFFCRPAQTTSIAFFSRMENNIVDMELVDYRLCPKVVSGRPNGISRNICHESRG